MIVTILAVIQPLLTLAGAPGVAPLAGMIEKLVQALSVFCVFS